MAEDAGLSRLLGQPRGPRAVGLRDIVVTLALVEDPLREILAHAIHHEYLRYQRGRGETRATNPALVPWNDLPEALKESNRAQAGHVREKLRAVGCRAVRKDHVVSPQDVFSDREIDTLARMEHERWVDERTRAGWRPGPKDLAKKTSPYLVPWERLDESVRQYDVNAVRTLPVVLAKADYEIERLA
jgi:hypothetical protein